MSKFSLFASNNWLVYNKQLAKILSPNCSIMIGTLSNWYEFCERNNTLTTFKGVEYFFCTREQIYEDTGLSPDQQRTVCSKLVAAGALEIIKRGSPAKNYYRLLFDNITEIMEKGDLLPVSVNVENQTLENPTTSSGEIQPLDVGKVDHYIKDKVKTINNNINNPEPTPKSSKEKKKKDIDKMFEMCDNISKDETVLKKLKQYLAFRLGRRLALNQWEIILNDLVKYCGNNNALMLIKIDNALAGGYNQLIASWEKEKGVVAAPNKKTYNYNNGEIFRPQAAPTLATNEDGELVTF